MKKFFKEILRFLFVLSVIILFFDIGKTNINLFYTIIGVLSLFLVFSIYFACRKKISKIWAIDILLAPIVFFAGITFLSQVFMNEMHEEYLKLRDQHRAEVASLPNEHLFDGMNKYDLKDVKFSDDKLFATDMEGTPITGVIVFADEPTTKIMKAFREGHQEGYNFVYHNNHILFANSKINDEFNISLFQEFFENQLIYEYKNNGEYIYGRRYSDSGKLIWDVINNIEMEGKGVIARGYNKEGRMTIEIDTFIHSGLCFLKNGTQRKATKEEMEQFFKEQEKSAAKSFPLEGVIVEPDYEFDFSCQE